MTNSNQSPAPVIVVGVDGSEPSKEALRWAGRQAELTGSKLRAVMIWHLPTAAYGPAFLPMGLDYTSDTREILTDTIREVLGEDPKVRIEPVVMEGPPGPELLRAARDAALLVVGNRGRGAFTGMLLGSVSEHCISHATCPVVVVRSRHEHPRSKTSGAEGLASVPAGNTPAE